MSPIVYLRRTNRRLALGVTPKPSGFSKLELLLSATLIGIFAAILLNRLMFYQEAAEKANVEYTISMLKSALRVQMATMLVEGRVQDYVLLERQNPMDWLEEKPGNYSLGSVNGDAGGKCNGCWYFNPGDRTLTYRPARSEYLQPDKSGEKRLRLQVRTVRKNNCR